MPAGRKLRLIAALTSSLLLVLAACAPAAPTPEPAQPAPATPAEPAPKPAEPAPKPAEPAAKPAPKPAEPAPKPAEPAPKPGALTDAERAEVEAFYRGKTIRIIVGFAAGGGYDAFARLTGRHLSRYIPGNPTIIVENMLGAGSLTSANHVYNVAPKDGTMIGTFSPGLVLEDAMGVRPDAFQFETEEFGWLGTPTVSTNHCILATRTGISDLQELIDTDQEITFGSTAPSSMATSAAPTLIGHYLNPNVRTIQGYDGIATVKLAVERDEVDGTCGTWQAFRSSHAEWLEGDAPVGFVVLKSEDDPDGQLDDVPALGDFLPEGEAQDIYTVAKTPDSAGFPYAAPPGLPEERLKALRIALIETWNDPEFLAEAQRADMAVIPLDHEELIAVLDQITGMPSETLERAAEVLGIE